jgi:hypothetical protein
MLDPQRPHGQEAELETKVLHLIIEMLHLIQGQTDHLTVQQLLQERHQAITEGQVHLTTEVQALPITGLLHQGICLRHQEVHHPHTVPLAEVPVEERV